MSLTIKTICIACAIVVVAGLLVYCVKSFLSINRCKKVMADSERVKELQKLNQLTSAVFVPLKRLYYSCSLSSKAKFDSFDPKQYFFIAATQDSEQLNELLQNAKNNEELWEKYLAAVKELPPTRYTNTRLQMAENKILEELRLKAPDVEPIVRVEWSYTSNQGNKFYSDSIYFGKSVIEEASRIADSKQSREAQIAHERALMNDKLRYEVMKRDGFKCVLCGSSVQDGVQLHIDHIYPVSKGGKTTLDNLRTLCDRCNVGKGNSLED